MARFRDLEELRRLNQELAQRNADLDAFAHMVAHDLRDPLNLIINYSKVLRERFGSLNAEGREISLSTISKCSRRMATIVNELLFLSTVRHEQIGRERLEMGRIVDSALDALDFLIEEKPDVVVDVVPSLGG